MGCWRTCSAGTTTAWYEAQLQMMVCTMMTRLSTFSWSSSLLARSLSSLILDQKACKKTFCCFECHVFRLWQIALTFVFQGGAHFQAIRGPQGPGLELYWSPSLLLPLVSALAGGERLLPHVHEQRLWAHKLCAALWQGVQGESGPCLHWHQIWSVLWELHQVAQPRLATTAPGCFTFSRSVVIGFFHFLSRSLVIKCSSYRQAHWWSHEINRLADTCDFLKEQRFDGFAPPRENTLTKWLVYLMVPELPGPVLMD